MASIPSPTIVAATPSPLRPPSDDQIKRRAAKACLSCRHRKVRCDVVGGVPCTNCRLDGVSCVIKKSNRGRRPANANANRESSGVGETVVAAVEAVSPVEGRQASTGAGSGVPNDFFPSLYFEG